MDPPPTGERETQAKLATPTSLESDTAGSPSYSHHLRAFSTPRGAPASEPVSWQRLSALKTYPNLPPLRLSQRALHRSAVIGNSLYVWAGAERGLPNIHDSHLKRELTRFIHIFDFHSFQWASKPVQGAPPPLGVVGYSCSVAGDKVYYFGGYCHHDNCYHNSLHELDVHVAPSWKQLQLTNAERPVMRRAFGAMISLECDGVHQLLMIGGVGAPPTVLLTQAKYIHYSTSRIYTNEHNLFNLSTGKWDSPFITGQCIPPASGFVIEKINGNRAIVFGEGEELSNGLYVIQIRQSCIDWQKLKLDVLSQCPAGRFFHAATIINSSVSPVLVVIGGLNRNEEPLKDCWLYDLSLQTWTKIDLPVNITDRYGHSLSVFTIGSDYAWLIVVGGMVKESNTYVPGPAVTVMIELVYKGGQWRKGCVVNSSEPYVQFNEESGPIPSVQSDAHDNPARMPSYGGGFVPRSGIQSGRHHQRVRGMGYRYSLPTMFQVHNDPTAMPVCLLPQADFSSRPPVSDTIIDRDSDPVIQYKAREGDPGTVISPTVGRLMSPRSPDEKDSDGELYEGFHPQALRSHISTPSVQSDTDHINPPAVYAPKPKRRSKGVAVSSLFARSYDDNTYFDIGHQEVQGGIDMSHRSPNEEDSVTSDSQPMVYGSQSRIKQFMLRQAVRQGEFQRCIGIALEPQSAGYRYPIVRDSRSPSVEEQSAQITSHSPQYKGFVSSSIRRKEYLLHVTESNVPVLELCLRSLRIRWYYLGQLLGVDESVLADIDKNVTKSDQLRSVLKHWCTAGGTVAELKAALVDMDRQDLISRLPVFEAPVMNRVDKSLQFNYVIPVMDKLDRLGSVNVAGKKLFLVQGEEPHFMNWEGYGLRIGVSQGTLPSTETAEITVVALVGGQFLFPQNTKLASAVYAVSISKLLFKPLRLEVQHCVDLTSPAQTKCLKFAIAPINTPSLPYKFSVIEGGEFSVGSWYGSISRNKFCLVSIVAELTENNGGGPGSDEESEGEGEGTNEEDPPSDDQQEDPPSDDQQEDPPSDDQQEQSDKDESDCTKAVPHKTETDTHVIQEIGEDTSAITSSVEQLSVSDHVNDVRSSSVPLKKEERSTVSATDFSYIAQLYYERKDDEDLVTFTASKRLDVLLKYIREEHQTAEIGQRVSFHFLGPSLQYIELVLNAPQKKPFTGWTIEPHIEPCKLFQSDIDNFGTAEYPAPPCCLISVYSDTEATKTLHYALPLVGVSDPVKLFIHRTKRKQQPAVESSISDIVDSDHGPLMIPRTANRTVKEKDVDVKKLKKAITRVLVSQHADLSSLPKESLPSLANRLYTATLISNEIKDNPSIDSIIHEFKAALTFMRKVTPIHEHCHQFLQSLTAVRGSYSVAADALAEEWTEAIQNELGTSFRFD